MPLSRVFSWKKPEKLRPLAVLQFHSEPVEALAYSLKVTLNQSCHVKYSPLQSS